MKVVHLPLLMDKVDTLNVQYQAQALLYREIGKDTTVRIGYLYEYLIKFPTIYPKKISGEKSFADVNSSLILHRIKLHFGKDRYV